MAQSIIEEVFEEIRKTNSRNDATSIPHSDEFGKTTAAMLGLSPDLINKIIQVLKNSHRIFAFEIILEDPVRGTSTIFGYVISDLMVVRKLKNIFQRELMYSYNHQFNKNLLVHQIVKEIFPIMKTFNNTALGEVANKAIMLNELENLMEKNFNEYTEDFKERQFKLEVNKANLEKLNQKKEKAHAPAAAVPEETAKEAPASLRAVDSKAYGDFVSKKNKYPLKRILNIYGIDFFYKVSLRNYQFIYLKQLIGDGQITKRTDLQHLRDMLHTVRSNVNRDEKLKDHLDEIYDLEKAVIHQLYFAGKEVPH